MKSFFQIKPSRPIITASQIKNHFQNPQNLSWVPIKSLLSSTAEQCVDGRSRTDIIGTPGGNMGEFILMLAAAEKVTGSKICSKEIYPLFEKYLKLFGKFYMHTDTHALNHLAQELKLKNITKLIRRPSRKIQPSLIEYLLEPQNIGCGHLKLMLLNPHEYQIAPALIKTCIRAFYHKLWSDGKQLEFVVLDKDHQEGAIVTVLVNSKNITGKTLIPTVASMGKDCQMFISHPQAEGFMRQKIASTIAKQKLIYGINTRNQKRFLNTINQMGKNLTRLTLSHLALGLPHYTVTLRQS